ncbi:hypothetical protein NX80_017925 [Xanthomonas vasicola pv. arecae]|uniref:hypothetical protein n=1 Tax=Xanthomonas vasicola TaxID=56459 RepID=UPI00052D7D55|nr:hypothetical protein [Xanthomonas vasicola]AZR28028.1 hypothetical protein NX80_017925 [Xanthomonas vasicola pv. arecae]
MKELTEEEWRILLERCNDSAVAIAPRRLYEALPACVQSERTGRRKNEAALRHYVVVARQSAELCVIDIVVFASPALDLGTRMQQCREPVLVEAFIA